MKTKILLTAALFGMIMQNSIFAENTNKTNESYLSKMPFETENISDYHNRLANAVTSNRTQPELTETVQFEISNTIYFAVSDSISANSAQSPAIHDSKSDLSKKETSTDHYNHDIPFETEKAEQYNARLNNWTSNVHASEISETLPAQFGGEQVFFNISFNQNEDSVITKSESISKSTKMVEAHPVTAKNNMAKTINAYLLDLPFNTEKIEEYHARLITYITHNHIVDGLIETTSYISNAVYCFEEVFCSEPEEKVEFEKTSIYELPYATFNILTKQRRMFVTF